MSVQSKRIDYSQPVLQHGSYKYHKILPLSTVDTFSAGGGDVIEFDIPSVCMNLPKTIVRYQAKIDAAAANASNHKVHTSCWQGMRSIEVLSSTGQTLLSINDLDKYTKMVWNYTPITELMSHGAPTTVYSFANIAESYDGPAPVTGAGDALDSICGQTSRGYGHGRRCILSGTAEAGGNESVDDPAWEMQIPLGLIYDSLFALPQDLYFGQNLTLRLTTHPTSRFVFNATAASFANQAAYAGDITVQNVELHLAVQQNPVICDDLKAAVQSGFRMKIPYVYQTKYSAGAQTSQNVSARWNKGYGNKIRKCFVSAFASPETLGNAYDNESNNITSFDVYVNATKLNQQLLTPDIAWRENRDRLRPYVCGVSQQEYKDFFVYDVNFVDEDNPVVMGDKMYSDGLPIDDSIENKVEIQATTAAAAQVWYMYTIMERELVIGSAGEIAVL